MATEIPNYTIRPMKREEIPAVLDLWRETGLSEGTYSLDTWYEYDPEGFYVAVTDDGTVIGSCAGILQNQDLYFVGLYVVKSEYQRRGIGRKIWNAVMDRIEDSNVGVNPVPDQLENYRDRSGLPTQTSWCSVVCNAAEVSVSHFQADDVMDVKVQSLTSEDEDIVSRVVQYDADIFGFSKENLVPLLCEQKESITLVAIRTTDNEVCGYGNIKNNIKGNALVGPLFADNADIAEMILRELISQFPLAKSKGVTMMTIDCNEPAMEMVSKLGFQKEDGIARLYRKEEVHVKYEKIFGQHNLNFSVF